MSNRRAFNITYPIVPKSDVLLLIKELDSTVTLSYFLDENVVIVCREFWICVMTRIIRTPLNVNMLRVQDAPRDYQAIA